MTGARKVVLLAVIVLAGGILAYFSLVFNRTQGPEVEVEAVERRDLQAIVSASGTIVPQLTVDISANTMGRVTRLEFNEGDRVVLGQFLLEIDPEALRSAVDRGEAALQASQSAQRQAEVSVQTSRVNLQLARDNLERQEDLWELRLVSRENYERALNDVMLRETELEAREVEVATQAQRIKQEEANLQSARYELTKVTITSPIAGVVTRRNIEEGETVVVGTMNNQGTVLATIADLSVIEAEVEVDETDIPSVQLGQRAIVTIDALPDEGFTGTVTEIGNSPIQAPTGNGVGGQATNFKVVVTLDEEIPAVRPGFTCTADITTAVRTASLAIPIQAATVREVTVDRNGEIARVESELRTRNTDNAVSPGQGSRPASGGQSRWQRLIGGGDESATDETLQPPDGTGTVQELEGVFVARENLAVFIPVETGIAGDRYFEALSGINAGDLIITGPFADVRTLADGDPIQVVEDASSR